LNYKKSDKMRNYLFTILPHGIYYQVWVTLFLMIFCYEARSLNHSQ